MGATKLPEGFEEQRSKLVFQNPASWTKAGETGRMVHGIYEGKLEEDAYGKENYKFTSLESGVTYDKEGNEIEYDAETTIIINATGSLDKKMEGVNVGAEVIVDFDGKIILTKGPMKGKSANTFSVYVRN